MYAVILLSLMSLSVKMTVSPWLGERILTVDDLDDPGNAEAMGKVMELRMASLSF
jgi:hypothetical protein